MLDSDLLKTFLAIVDAKNFTKASVRLGRTQSAISVQIAKLEAALGEPLFVRTSRGVLLTGKGVDLVPRAREIISLLHNAEAALKRPQLSGLVRIGLADEYRTSILPSVLRNFDVRHPGVEIVVRLGGSETLNEALRNGVLDLAVFFEPSGEGGNEVLRRDPIVWVTSKIHNTHRRTPLPVAMYSVDTWDKRPALASLEKLSRPFHFAYFSDNAAGLVAGVQAGLGIAPLPRSSILDDCRELDRSEQFEMIDDSKIVLRMGKNLNTAAQDMAQSIREAFAA